MGWFGGSKHKNPAPITGSRRDDGSRTSSAHHVSSSRVGASSSQGRPYLQQQQQQQQQNYHSSASGQQRESQSRTGQENTPYVNSSNVNRSNNSNGISESAIQTVPIVEESTTAAVRQSSYVSAASASHADPRLMMSSSTTVADTTLNNNSGNELTERHDSDDEALMVIDRPPNKHKSAYDVEDPSNSYSKEFEAEGVIPPTDQMDGAARQNHLNSLFNGHLMKWKFEAEEGSIFIRVPAFFGAIGLITTAVVSLVVEPKAWEPSSIVMSACVIIMSMFVLILDGRFLSTNPLSARAHLRNIMTRNFNIFRFVWGRGLLYIAAGILNCAQIWTLTMYSGTTMIGIGLIAVIVGVHASRKFAALRNSLADESFLLLVFSNYDSDGDGYLLPNEFAMLLADLGMELDDRYTLKAFTVIDTDNDRKVAFDEFSHWWASGYIERGRRRRTDDDEDDVSYRRID